MNDMCKLISYYILIAGKMISNSAVNMVGYYTDIKTNELVSDAIDINFFYN